MGNNTSIKLNCSITSQKLNGSIASHTFSGGIKLPSSTPVENDYNRLKNKPSINGITVEKNKSFEDLGCDSVTNAEIKSIYASIIGTYYK